MEFSEFIFNVLMVVITTFVPILGFVAHKYVKRQTLLADLFAKEELVTKAVEFVEQAYHDLNGHQKFEYALEWTSNTLKNAGIKFTNEELRGLIEAAVLEMQAGWWSYYVED